MGRVAGKVALVTGGAKGLGLATARRLFEEGATVVITDVDDHGGAAAADLDPSGEKVVFYRQDVTDEAEWDSLTRTIVDRFGKLDVVVNNAGVAASRTVEEETLETWRWLMAVNLDAVFLGTKAAIAVMKDNGGGSIVNLSSIEGIIGDPGLAAYNASKGGVRIFSKSAALHCAKSGYGIRVNTVHPGFVWTPMVEEYAAEQDAALDEVTAALVAAHPIGRMGKPEEIANAVLYLASDESSFSTGSEIVVDGGYTAQ
ncbi:glucose 1-dehydrogenase [Gordonia sp. (in: high G+C Gram-positive bacteria)]|uniref:glucose 1-dehydrogenase n=1 Tax=Gordonia sp. (in: high G+C Gram-positive bacteria) TaxID=84139 RepID=UPI0026327160|nr:glucose 1-dehydrogenase [Gordonia sp. (in: high G+C Gram-positive bacteria)]